MKRNFHDKGIRLLHVCISYIHNYVDINRYFYHHSDNFVTYLQLSCNLRNCNLIKTVFMYLHVYFIKFSLQLRLSTVMLIESTLS